MIVVYMMRLEGICNFSFKKLAVFGEMVKGILANGIPVGIQSTVLALSNVIVQAAKNSYGDIVIAGATAAGTIEGYIGVVLSGFATAVITMVSQNVGAKRYDRVKEILKMAMGMTPMIA
jgi:Na+-driven multidrug efflux pump